VQLGQCSGSVGSYLTIAIASSLMSLTIGRSHTAFICGMRGADLNTVIPKANQL
jgi:hypothetical protein